MLDGFLLFTILICNGFLFLEVPIRDCIGFLNIGFDIAIEKIKYGLVNILDPSKNLELSITTSVTKVSHDNEFSSILMDSMRCDLANYRNMVPLFILNCSV